jgi:hypothetical protein
MLSNTRLNNYNKLKGNMTLDPKYWYFVTTFFHE